MSAKVSYISNHPKNVIQRVRNCAANLESVDFSENLNDLCQARKVSMSAIWKCLEEGEIVKAHLKFQENGTYMKLQEFVAGVRITIDILMEDGDQRLVVLWADEEEEY